MNANQGILNVARLNIAWLLLCFLLLGASGARAACTGSGTTWSCSAGTTSAQIAEALNSASDGATLTFAAGNYSWTSFTSFSNSKGATLICQSPGACLVTPSGTVIGMNGNLSGTNTKLYRVSGFKFQNGGTGPTIWFYGSGTMSRLRIDNNIFTNYADTATVMFLGEVSTIASFYGVIDHNTLTNSSNMMLLNALGGQNPTGSASVRGTASNLFIEDNTMTFTTMTNAGQGCVDGWGGDAIVWRHNKTTNCLVTQHGVVHAGGPINFEMYENSLKVDSGASSAGFADCYRCFHHQGSGEFIAFNNTFSATGGKTGVAISMTHYRSATPSAAGYSSSVGRCDGTNSKDGNRIMGYPCWRQPGRDGLANLQPMYVWNNKWSDTGGKIDMAIENPWNATSPSVDTHIANNRDYYNAVSASAQTSSSSPFNGSTGMGFGALANRPATCTTNTSESGGGVGYFAVDQGSQGALYRCSATNTWTAHYQPYTYPHPLVTASGTVPLSPPTNLTAH